MSAPCGRRLDVGYHPFMPRLCPPAKLHAAMDVVEDDLEAGLDLLAGLARKYAKDPAVRYACGASLLDAGRAAEALDHLEFVARRASDEDVREALLDAYFALGMVLHAERLLQRSGGQLDAEVDAEVEMLRNHGPSWRELPRKDLLAFERARVAAVRRDRGAAQELARLADRHPTWTTVRIALAGTQLAAGDLDGFYVAADAAFETDPDDALALLHATRAAFLREGTVAARAFRDRLDTARSNRGVVAALIARADAAAVMDDEGALRTLLGGLDAALVDAEEDVTADAAQLHASYERRASDPDAPLASVAELLFGVFAAWVGRSEDEVEARAGRDLARAPGLLRELPRRIGYENEGTIRILASVLLSAGAPPAPEATWRELLPRVASEGPGTQEGRVALLGFLHEVGEIDASESVPFAGLDGGVTMHGFEVSGEPLPSSLSERDQERVEEVMRGLTRGRLAPALAVLPELIGAYPDEASLEFNLAVAEKLAGREVEARARLERLHERHPDYLFARADLAVEALDAGDLDRAEGLLAVPTGRTRLHVHEWAAFAAALGRLALARGDVDGAERYLNGIDRTAGQAHGAYRMLEDAIDRQVLAGVSDDAVTDPPVDAIDVLASVDLDDVPSLDELGELPLLDEAWSLASAPVAFPVGERGAMQRVGMLTIAHENGFVRAMTLHDQPLDGETAFAHLAQACSGGMTDAEPGRPRTVVVDDPTLLEVLAPHLRGTGMRAVRGDAAAAREAIESVSEAMGSGVPTWLAHASAIEARSFLHASVAFYDADAWEAFDPDRPVAFRVADDAWRYATLMGHGGEEFGLALFQSWRAYQAFVGTDQDADAHDRLAVAGAFESVSLSPLGTVSPLDAPIYLDATDARAADDAVPVFARFQPDGFATPAYRPSVYGALLTLLAQRAARVTTRVRRIDATVETLDGPLRVRYPATGAESADEPARPAGRA